MMIVHETKSGGTFIYVYLQEFLERAAYNNKNN